jgi:hypothetical protein
MPDRKAWGVIVPGLSLLFAALFLASPAFAADLGYLPHQRNQSTLPACENETYIFQGYPEHSYFSQSCADESTLSFSTTISSIICDKCECLDTFSYYKTCAFGCSETLNDCRYDLTGQLLLFVLITAGLAAIVYLSYNYLPGIGIYIGFVVLIFLIGVSITDMFATWTMNIVRIYTIAYMGFLITLFRKVGREEREKEADVEGQV